MADIDHYDQRRDFTIDQQNWQDLPTYFDYIHSLGMKTVMILDPAVVVNDTSYWPYADAKDKDIFIKWPNNMNNIDANETNSSFNIMLGYVSAALLVAIKSVRALVCVLRIYKYVLLFHFVSVGQREKLPIQTFSRKKRKTGGSNQSRSITKRSNLMAFGL